MIIRQEAPRIADEKPAIATPEEKPILAPVEPIKPEAVPGTEELKPVAEQPERVSTEKGWVKGWTVSISPEEISIKPEANKPSDATDFGAGFQKVVSGKETDLLIVVTDIAQTNIDVVDGKEPGEAEAGGNAIADLTDQTTEESQEVATE
jgi:hypothetical protein